VAATLSAPAARAADEPAQPYVVLVGVDQYTDPQIKPRQHAEADAKAMYDLFASPDYLGVNPKHIKLLLGKPDPGRPSEAATRANVLAALNWITKGARRDDLVVFAFFGNGAPLGDHAAYFTVDSTFKNRAKDAIASGDIQNILDSLQSQRFVAFLDCNFLGFDAGKDTAPDPKLESFYREFLGNEEAKVTPSRVVFLANSGLKPSLNLGEHGVFAQSVIAGLKGKADVQGYEPDGNITVNELGKFVYKEQHRLTVENGKSDDEKGQQAWVLSSTGYFDPQKGVLEGQGNDFIISHNPGVHPKASARLEKFDDLAQKQNLDKALAEEGHNLLDRMPKLEAQQSLRKAYQKLADGAIDMDAFQAERRNILDATVISEKDAGAYATMVLKAAKVVRQGYVKDVTQATLIDYAVRGIFKHLGEKVPSAIKDKLETDKSMKEGELKKLLVEVRRHLGKREDLANGKDITYSLHAMMAKLDKHTDYIDPDMLRQMENDIRGHFSGIGVQIRKNNTKDVLQVVTPIRGSPAYKAKIYANDLITTIIREVDSEGNPLDTPDVIPTKGLTTEDAVKKILGKEGTKVKLLIEREGADKPIEFNLIRGKVEVESVMGGKRNSDDSWNYVVDPENKICYVRLYQFSHNTHRDLENVMKKLSKVGIKGFILDLRFNPGGLLDSAVKISDMFIDDGMIVTIKPRSGAPTSYVGQNGKFTAFPMVCLINGGSASASEIVSACLQDHGRAIIIGTRSYGKGSVQTIHPFETGGRLKLTTATFWRPTGRNLNRASTNGKDEDEWGVTPNDGFVIKLNAKELSELQEHQRNQEIIHRPGYEPSESQANFRDRQLESALDYLRAQIKLAKVGATKKRGG
jgi:C-terminal peptidase prc